MDLLYNVRRLMMPFMVVTFRVEMNMKHGMKCYCVLRPTSPTWRVRLSSSSIMIMIMIEYAQAIARTGPYAVRCSERCSTARQLSEFVRPSSTRPLAAGHRPLRSNGQYRYRHGFAQLSAHRSGRRQAEGNKAGQYPRFHLSIKSGGGGNLVPDQPSGGEFQK